MGYRLLTLSGLVAALAIYFYLEGQDQGQGVSWDLEMAGQGNLTAFVLGGSGAVGKDIIKALAAAPQFTKVTLIGRRQVPLPPPTVDKRYDKFEEKIIDFDNLEEYKEAFKGHDVGFSTLGTTRGQSGAAGFYKVDHDYVVNTAKLAKAGGTRHLHLVSSGGANKDSFFLYPKTKGEVEAELSEMGFERLSIYRPGLLLPEKREDFRLAENMFRVFLKPLDRCRWFSVDTAVLGKVIVANSFTKMDEGKKGVEIIYNKDVIQMGKALQKEEEEKK